MNKIRGSTDGLPGNPSGGPEEAMDRRILGFAGLLRIDRENFDENKVLKDKIYGIIMDRINGG